MMDNHCKNSSKELSVPMLQLTMRGPICSSICKRAKLEPKKVCRKHGVQVHFKGGNTIKSFLMVPKDKDPITKKSGIIYRYKCNRVDCDDEYIEKLSRTFGEVQGTL